MGLEPAMNTKIGCRYEKSISLGEKKRLSFACEILTDPAILFCDEPTSGLDAFMTVQVMKALVKLAHARKTVICSIHQPSSQVFQMANWLVLIAKGQIAYQGPIDDVAAFFSGCGMPCPQYVSVPDHFMKMISGGHSNEDSATACRKRTNVSSFNYCAVIYVERIAGWLALLSSMQRHRFAPRSSHTFLLFIFHL